MKSTTELKAYKKFGPGYFIMEELKTNKMSEKEFSDLYGIADSELDGILRHDKPISKETAAILAKAFETSMEYWLNIDSSYRLWLNEKNMLYNI